MNEDRGMVPNPSAPAAPARQWRVGSLSMGLSLLLLGVFFLASRWQGTEVFDSALKWWPIVLIMLGIEVVGYTLFFRKGDYVRYDVFSILLIGFLTVCSLGLAALSSTGWLDEVRREANLVYKTVQIPEQSMIVPVSVDKIIVQGSDPERIKKDSNSTQEELMVFGSFRTTDKELLAGDGINSLVQIRQVGNILYITLNDPPSLVRHSYEARMDVTVSAPSKIKIIVRDADGNQD